jgi:predicted nuclease of restriction endonuclease-like RecB superfamily
LIKKEYNQITLFYKLENGKTNIPNTRSRRRDFSNNLIQIFSTKNNATTSTMSIEMKEEKMIWTTKTDRKKRGFAKIYRGKTRLELVKKNIQKKS